MPSTIWFHSYAKSNEQYKLIIKIETDIGTENRLTVGKGRGLGDKGKGTKQKINK